MEENSNFSPTLNVIITEMKRKVELPSYLLNHGMLNSIKTYNINTKSEIRSKFLQKVASGTILQLSTHLQPSVPPPPPPLFIQGPFLPTS